LKALTSPNAPRIRLENVENFNIYQSRPIADVHLDKVDQKNL
jgi:hypothetical protein